MLAIFAFASGTSAATARSIVTATNRARDRHDLQPVKFSRLLSATSRRYARQLAHTGVFRHDPAGIWASHRFQWRGECLLWNGRRLRAREVVRRWLDSPGHRAILLEPSARYMGAGQAARKGGGVYWTAQLGHR